MDAYTPKVRVLRHTINSLGVGGSASLKKPSERLRPVTLVASNYSTESLIDCLWLYSGITEKLHVDTEGKKIDIL